MWAMVSWSALLDLEINMYDNKFNVHAISSGTTLY